MTPFGRITTYIKARYQTARIALAAFSTPVVNHSNKGWGGLTDTIHDRPYGERIEHYRDALHAWRENPMIRRIVNVIADFVLSDDLIITSPNENMQAFIDAFWHDPENHMPLRLSEMLQEQSRSGDLFVVLFMNKENGMSYIRFITKDQVEEIVCAPTDWEKEIKIIQIDATQESGRKTWITPAKARKNSRDVILHFPINRPIGAKFGESDVGTILKWASRYSTMLTDRVRLNHFLRTFLWFVTVPDGKIAEKSAQYKTPPKSGSVIVKTENEQWEVESPNLRGADASHDLQAIRQYAYTGSMLPPQWLGEQGSNLAEAKIMQTPAERFLKTRQRRFVWSLQTILFTAYTRASHLYPERYPALQTTDYRKLFTVDAPDISRSDNTELADAAQKFTNSFAALADTQLGKSKAFTKLAMRLWLKFTGEQITAELLDEIMGEAFDGHQTDKPIDSAEPVTTEPAKEEGAE